MFARFFGSQIAAFVLALGIVLSGVGPTCATPPADHDSMPGMNMVMADMPMPSDAAMDKSSPDKQIPCKGSDNSCAVCIACAVNVGAPQRFLPVLFYHGEVRALSREASRNGIATPPAHPPPILHG
jgi:hypothetical protein